MKRILLINNGYPSKEFKNNCTYIKSIEEALIESSFDVKLIVLRKKRNGLISNILSYLAYYFKIIQTSFKNYDHIYINHLPQVLIPLLLKINNYNEKVWLHWHGDDLISNNIINKITRFLIRRKIIIIKHHITPSSYFRNELSLRCNVDPGLIYITPSGGVDTKLFENKKNKVSLLKKSKIVLGFPSALTREKGLDFLLLLIRNRDIIRDHLGKEISFEVINYGKERILLNEYEHFNWLIVNNVMPKEIMPDFYERVDIVLMFSRRPAESLGLVSLEAMSCGCPVIGLKDFAMTEYIQPGKSGEFTLYNNLFSFIGTLKTIIHNYEQYSPSDTIQLNYSKKKVINDYKFIFT